MKDGIGAAKGIGKGIESTDDGDPTALRGAVIIGAGTTDMQYASHEILLAALPNPDGQKASIRLRPNGEILINERLVGRDEDVVEAFRLMLYQLMGMQHVVRECDRCHSVTTRPAVPELFVCPQCRQAIRGHNG